MNALEFVEQDQNVIKLKLVIVCEQCGSQWALTLLREDFDSEGNPAWLVCKRCGYPAKVDGGQP